MDVDDLQRRADLLRAELKVWERENSVNQKKPTRDAIKQNPDIAKKYTEFHKIKDALSGKEPKVKRAALPSPKPQKRKHEDPTASTPSKRQAATPSKPSPLKPYEIDPYDSPSLIRKLFTPSTIRFLGPTPQKDGQPLGLFDLLSDTESPQKTQTPSRKGLHATPSKRPTSFAEFASTHKHSRTPNSSGKRHMLDAFLTPSYRVSKSQNLHKTPTTVSKLDFFGTPSFLRRGGGPTKSLASIIENGDEEPSSPGLRLPRKSLMRGLSSIAADLRRVQEEAAEEELDILRELEGASNMPSTSPVTAFKLRTNKPAPKIQVEDSQAMLPPSGLLGGFDDPAMFDSEPEEQMDRGQPLKAYKKKGQKRTTRRSNLKPVRSKAGKSAATKEADSSDTDSQFDQHPPPDLDTSEFQPLEETIADSQAPDGFQPDARNFDTDSSGTEYTASEGGTRYKRAKQKKKKKKIYDDDGKVKKMGRMRKVGAIASQNFQRLKLRNTGAKGGPGIGSRFRRKK